MSQRHADDVPDDPELHAFVDRELSPDDEGRVLARLAHDAEARERVAAYAHAKRQLREAGEAIARDVVDLRTAALERELARRLDRQAGAARRWAPQSFGVPSGGAMPWARAAALAAVFAGAGWFGHAEFAKRSAPLPGFVTAATGAHHVFGEDRERPGEFPLATIDEARGWLSAKLGRAVPVPSLDALGVKLVGARLLGAESGPLAQFIYEDGRGHRMSLVMAPHPENAPVHDVVLASAREAHVGYWRDASLDYALVARTSDTQLRAIAHEVSDTLSPKQARAANERKS